jgi:DNA invertase Pin-like site-specific DNA recombinase
MASYHQEQLPTKTKSKRAVLYTRVSTIDQDPQTQLYDLREMVKPTKSFASIAIRFQVLNQNVQDSNS